MRHLLIEHLVDRSKFVDNTFTSVWYSPSKTGYERYLFNPIFSDIFVSCSAVVAGKKEEENVCLCRATAILFHHVHAIQIHALFLLQPLVPKPVRTEELTDVEIEATVEIHLTIR